MYNALTFKPNQHIENLINQLKPESNTFETYARQKINYENDSSRKCYLLLSGSIALFRTRDGFMMNSESAPYVFGLSNQLAAADYLYMQTMEPSRIACLSLFTANAIIAERDLWESLSHLLIYTAGRVYDHCTRISAPTSYAIIRSQLYELMQESEEIRHSITAANYIQSRTFLSRSSIMKILAELKKGSYITTERGILLQIKQGIPMKY
ncbi:TPA: helix-turn-helix domain-containing protein [Klebsiella michiganensis]|nr:helix-turn-helix domain-containing protein [Klebsiella michiganensis]HCB1847720.1 helix-turn-helix domain-containing protein [Klebsiella oxytoca]